ncbi:hypothetical protein ACF1G0_26370, partial [Streptomyces sp. NPDC013953]|uniref:hypothetical protein n=1 Tax=Streptomyces sp. NPDC013953 TaxID=3364868 RepID=UPI0036F5E43F
DKKDHESKKDEDKYGKDHESKKDEYKKDEDKKDEYKNDKDKPHGGVHTGGGLLSTVTGDDWDKKDHESKKDEDKYGKDHESKKDEYKKDEDKYGKDKPHGGVHTGGGGLDSSAAPVAGGLALLGALGAGGYMLRRRAVRGGAA